MRFSTALALASAPLVAFGANQTITVGSQNQLMFEPANITAAEGDFINFQFASKNHSTTQSSFASPCTKLPTGVNSGFLAVGNSTAVNGSMPTWTIQITNASSPQWFYCAQKTPVPHCKMGMVFSINATPAKSHDMFVAAAMASNETAIPAATPAAPGSPSPPSGSAPGSASPSGSAPSSASSDSAASGSASSTGGDVGGVAASPSGTGGADTSGSGTQASSNSPSNTDTPNGASRTVFKRGAAGLLTIAAVGAILL